MLKQQERNRHDFATKSYSRSRANVNRLSCRFSPVVALALLVSSIAGAEEPDEHSARVERNPLPGLDGYSVQTTVTFLPGSALCEIGVSTRASTPSFAGADVATTAEAMTATRARTADRRLMLRLHRPGAPGSVRC